MNGRLQRGLVLFELACVALLMWMLTRAGWSLPAAAMTAVLTPLMVHAAIITHHFVVARIAGSPTPAAMRVSAAGAVRLVLMETAASVRTFNWLQPFREHAALCKPASAMGVPVLLLHGYLCNRAVWLPFARFLAERGHPVDAITMEPAFGSIDAYVVPIARAVTALQVRTGASRVAIVGHSMGGLALRAYLRQHGTSAVAAAVTLGTPHAGTRLANLGVGINARQMQCNSDWLRRLAATEDDEVRSRITVVLTHHDNIAVPQDSQRLDGAECIELAGIGHLALLFDRDVMRLVAQRLAAATADINRTGRESAPATSTS